MLTDLIKNFTSEPFSHFNDLEREFNRLFGPLHGVSSRHTTPAVNVWSSNEATHVVAEIPGVDPKDVDVSLEDRTLTIRGVRKPEALAEGETAIRREHTHGKFARTIELATPVAADKATAVHQNGVLRITLPRAKESLPRKIKVS